MTNANVMWAVRVRSSARVSAGCGAACSGRQPARLARDSPVFVSPTSYLRSRSAATCSLNTCSVSLARTVTADTVSVLQQAPGTIITRAPDEVQWACGGWSAGSAAAAGRAWRRPRALLQVPDSWGQPWRRSSARGRRLVLFLARGESGGARLGGRSGLDCSSEPAPRPPRAARRQLMAAAPALTLARPPPRGGRGRWPRPRKPPRESAPSPAPPPAPSATSLSLCDIHQLWRSMILGFVWGKLKS